MVTNNDAIQLLLSSKSSGARQEKPRHLRYLNEFRTQQCLLFLEQQCQFHRPYTCFHWHFPNQKRRRPFKRPDGTFNYNPDVYCDKYDETTGSCADGDECPYAHRNAGDTERRYHPRYFKTGNCIYETMENGACVKNGLHCAFAHGPDDIRLPVYDIREIQDASSKFTVNLPASLEKERVLSEDPKWNEMFHVLACYKTELCKKPPRMCRQGYSCPFYHNGKDKRRAPDKFVYRSTPCPVVRPGDEWQDSGLCETGDSCVYCHTRTEQQFHPEIYKSTKCNDVLNSGYCPRGPFCAFAHCDSEIMIGRNFSHSLQQEQCTTNLGMGQNPLSVGGLGNVLDPVNVNNQNHTSNTDNFFLSGPSTHHQQLLPDGSLTYNQSSHLNNNNNNTTINNINSLSQFSHHIASHSASSHHYHHNHPSQIYTHLSPNSGASSTTTNLVINNNTSSSATSVSCSNSRNLASSLPPSLITNLQGNSTGHHNNSGQSMQQRWTTVSATVNTNPTGPSVGLGAIRGRRVSRGSSPRSNSTCLWPLSQQPQPSVVQPSSLPSCSSSCNLSQSLGLCNRSNFSQHLFMKSSPNNSNFIEHGSPSNVINNSLATSNNSEICTTLSVLSSPSIPSVSTSSSNNTLNPVGLLPFQTHLSHSRVPIATNHIQTPGGSVTPHTLPSSAFGRDHFVNCNKGRHRSGSSMSSFEVGPCIMQHLRDLTSPFSTSTSTYPGRCGSFSGGLGGFTRAGNVGDCASGSNLGGISISSAYPNVKQTVCNNSRLITFGQCSNNMNPISSTTNRESKTHWPTNSNSESLTPDQYFSPTWPWSVNIDSGNNSGVGETESDLSIFLDGSHTPAANAVTMTTVSGSLTSLRNNASHDSGLVSDMNLTSPQSPLVLDINDNILRKSSDTGITTDLNNSDKLQRFYQLSSSNGKFYSPAEDRLHFQCGLESFFEPTFETDLLNHLDHSTPNHVSSGLFGDIQAACSHFPNEMIFHSPSDEGFISTQSTSEDLEYHPIIMSNTHLDCSLAPNSSSTHPVNIPGKLNKDPIESITSTSQCDLSLNFPRNKIMQVTNRKFRERWTLNSSSEGDNGTGITFDQVNHILPSIDLNTSDIASSESSGSISVPLGAVGSRTISSKPTDILNTTVNNMNSMNPNSPKYSVVPFVQSEARMTPIGVSKPFTSHTMDENFSALPQSPILISSPFSNPGCDIERLTLRRELDEVRQRLDSKEDEVEALRKQRDFVTEHLRGSLGVIRQLFHSFNISPTPSTSVSDLSKPLFIDTEATCTGSGQSTGYFPSNFPISDGDSPDDQFNESFKPVYNQNEAILGLSLKSVDSEQQEDVLESFGRTQLQKQQQEALAALFANPLVSALLNTSQDLNNVTISDSSIQPLLQQFPNQTSLDSNSHSKSITSNMDMISNESHHNNSIKSDISNKIIKDCNIDKNSMNNDDNNNGNGNSNVEELFSSSVLLSSSNEESEQQQHDSLCILLESDVQNNFEKNTHNNSTFNDHYIIQTSEQN